MLRISPTPRLALGAALVLAATGCVGGARSGRRSVPEADGAARPAGPAAPAAEPGGGTPVYLEDREVGRLTDADFEAFNRAWVLFVRKDRGWPAARDAWLARGGAAPYVLSENLLRYFMSATAWGNRKDLNWIAVSAQKCGEPAVGYFGNLLRLDTRPLPRPVTVTDSEGKSRTLTEWRNDDVTRQQLAYVLAAVGAPAVPALSSSPYLHAESMSARRYVMYALGRIGTDPAVDAVGTMLGEADWQDRGSATKALGLALNFAKNERARPYLQRALSDPDTFVRKKAEEGLAGKTKSEF